MICLNYHAHEKWYCLFQTGGVRFTEALLASNNKNVFLSTYQHLVIGYLYSSFLLLKQLVFRGLGHCIAIQLPLSTLAVRFLILFYVFQCTQQVCPVSPAVFIWAREPACAVPAEEEITGVAICDYNFKPQMPLNVTFTQIIFFYVFKL